MYNHDPSSIQDSASLGKGRHIRKQRVVNTGRGMGKVLGDCRGASKKEGLKEEE